MLGVKDRSTIHRYITGDRKPSPKVVELIEKITDGEVLQVDFEDTSPPKCAVVIDGSNGEPRLYFPWSRGYRYQEAAFEKTRYTEPGPDTPSNTIIDAIEILAGRARITPRGRFMLDGRPTDARRVVLAANRQLASDGKSELEYPSTPKGMK
ncbi:hypothetical protein COB72_05525 [bacterium]|nr:MAG: hypothetical protein COB72_05525 [bacterium]